MGDTLRHRFLRAASPLNVFLKLSGTCISNLGSKWNRYLINMWSLLWLSLTIYCNLYLFITRALDPLFKLLFEKEGSFWIFTMNNFISKLTGPVFGISTQILFVFSIRTTASQFWSQLEPDDLQLCRPPLDSLKLYSICAIIWILSMVK